MAKIGVPTGLQMVFEVGAFAFSAMMIGWISAEAQAAHNIAINLASISYMVASGVAAATTVRVANQLGRKDYRTLREAGKVSFFISAAIMLAFGLLFLLGRNTLPLMYIQEHEVVSIASTLLIIAVMFQLSDGLQAVALGALRGMQDVKIPTFITLLAYWAVAIPFGYVFGVRGNLGVEGIWYGLAIGLSLSAVLLIWRFLKVSKRTQIL
jgi:MATE family multidrug resistance protein